MCEYRQKGCEKRVMSELHETNWCVIDDTPICDTQGSLFNRKTIKMNNFLYKVCI